MNNVAMTIAGSDSSGGAGIQADLKTFAAFGVYGASVITALTAQNTTGVQGVELVPVEFIRTQLESVLDDIPVNAVKTGMLAEPAIVLEVAKFAKQGKLARLVVDPVMISKSGHPLLSPRACDVLIKELIPHAYVLTPNTHEAEKLTGVAITAIENQKKAAEKLFSLGVKYPIVKGGHLSGNESTDVLFDGVDFHFFSSERFDTKHTHGTGCTFASAITAGLAKGQDIKTAISKAKEFIAAAINTAPQIGMGNGPVNHMVDQKARWV